MKNIFLSLLLLIIVSCSNTNSPYEPKEEGIINSHYSTMIEGINLNSQILKDTIKRDTIKKSPINTKRALPLPCLNLDSTQMKSFILLRNRLEKSNLELRKEFEVNVKRMKDSIMALSNSKVNVDSINKLINGLNSQIKEIEIKQSQLEKIYKNKSDSVSLYYKNLMKSVGTDRTKLQELENKRNSELKELTTKYTSEKNDLLNKKSELQKQIMNLQSKLKDVKVSPDNKRLIEEQIKKMELELKSKMEANEKEFLELFRKILNPEQQVIFNNWLKGIDCDKTTKKVTN